MGLGGLKGIKYAASMLVAMSSQESGTQFFTANRVVTESRRLMSDSADCATPAGAHRGGVRQHTFKGRPTECTRCG